MNPQESRELEQYAAAYVADGVVHIASGARGDSGIPVSVGRASSEPRLPSSAVGLARAAKYATRGSGRPFVP